MFKVSLFFFYRSDSLSPVKTLDTGPHPGGSKSFPTDIPITQFKQMLKSDFESLKNSLRTAPRFSYGNGPDISPSELETINYKVLRSTKGHPDREVAGAVWNRLKGWSITHKLP